MKIIDIKSQIKYSGSNGKMDPKKIKFLVVHHDAEYVPVRGYNTLERIKAHHRLHIAKGWRHHSYHYAIDNVGDIYAVVDEKEVGYHAGHLPTNKSSIAVVLHGNFEIQEPTKKQLESLKNFITWITTKRPDLPLVVKSTVKGHRYFKATSCPGKNVFKHIK